MVGPTGRLEGVVTADRAKAVPAHQRPTTRLGDIGVPIVDVPVSRPEEPMVRLLPRMHAAGGTPAVVLDPSGRLAGLVILGDVARAADRRHPDALRV
jgi:CBS-domain-containing membrane protein